MVPVLLIGIPLLAGLIGFSLKDAAAKSWALFASILVLVVSLTGICLAKAVNNSCSALPGWVPWAVISRSARRHGSDTLFTDCVVIPHHFYCHLEG